MAVESKALIFCIVAMGHLPHVLIKRACGLAKRRLKSSLLVSRGQTSIFLQDTIACSIGARTKIGSGGVPVQM